ncbi:hypothetical protein [Allobranchiibius sp. GilTou73]|uniref:hypothetical protein n=1 Tax=Allobranchiibius sp. GilTou73 TaxID=2904523 RepID=UPI001F3C60A2|nr:hypothetical protein [Allobranchiibius sp. GilTou73]UIJ35754.1 hypothetical protein LVQ62_05045 [Allobranchiibius sp. GilTou73]
MSHEPERVGPSEDDPTRPMPAASLGSHPHPVGTAPALRRPRWSGKKSAVVAALAIGLSSAGAIGAAAASPAGQSGGGGTARWAPGGFGGTGTRGGTGTHDGTGTRGGARPQGGGSAGQATPPAPGIGTGAGTTT